MIRVRGLFREPVRVERPRASEFIEFGNFAVKESHIDRFEIVVELRHLRSADNDARDMPLSQQPGQGDLGGCSAVGFGRYPHCVDYTEAQFFVERNEIEAGQAIFRSCERFPRVFATQKTTGERAPDSQPGASGAKKLDKFMFEIATQKGIVQLAAAETGPTALALEGDRSGGEPCGPIRKTDVANFSRAHQIIVHKVDVYTPLEETLEALNEWVRMHALVRL